MSEFHHPIRDAKIHTYKRTDSYPGGKAFCGHFSPRGTYPVKAYGDSEAEVVSSLEAMRTEAIEKYEAQAIARQEGLAKAAAKRAAKREAKEASQ